MKSGQVNSKSAVTIQGVKKRKKIDKFLSFKSSKRCEKPKKIDKFLSFKSSKRCGHEAVIRSKSE